MINRSVSLIVTVVCACAALVTAHESDQYVLPTDRPFADMGDYLDTVHCLAVERAVERLNAEIAHALTIRDPERRARRLAKLHGPERAADMVYASFSGAGMDILEIEHALRTGWAGRAHPDQYTIHQTPDWLYMYTHLPIDPRRIPLLFQSSTMKAYGVYFGTDKISHFHHMGRMYFNEYLREVDGGMSHENALRTAARSYHNSIIGEWTFLGGMTTGVHSNADLVADYLGLKFFINVTQPVRLKGEIRPPMMVRRGDFWRVNKHVRRESGWFGWYVSDHWNEALNPPNYTFGLRSTAEWVIRRRADRTTRFYEEIDGRPPYASYYEDLSLELMTYYGEDYGHNGDAERLLTIGDMCYEQQEAPRVAERGAAPVPVAARSRTALTDRPGPRPMPSADPDVRDTLFATRNTGETPE